MNSQVCVNCNNKKAINRTDNRLVTERCGHVKCMDCLLQEKSGCVACAEDDSKQDHNSVLEVIELVDDVNALQEEKQTVSNDLSRKKPETSHIKIETDASGTKYYLCTVCNKKSQTRKHTSYHAYCNGQKKPYQCTDCKQGFVSQSHYKYHMRVHRNEKIYACDTCGLNFVQMSKLKRHKLKHTDEKMFSCTQCGKSFNNVTALRKHTLTHSEERPYSCDTCGKKFRDNSNYKKHVQRHKDSSWSCNVCGHIAESQVAMEQHSLSHGGSSSSVVSGRSHQCPRCPQAFHSRKDMRRHLAVHTDSKPFRCKLCDRHFRRKDNLERHIRNTHPDLYAPASAMDCDENALKQIANGQTHTDLDKTQDMANEKNEKSTLEILNPLPPLSHDIIQKHITDSINVNAHVNESIDKMSILEANNARQSVIVEKRNAEVEKVSSPENEYVHKIRKAIIPLPPIDQEKFQNVRRGILPDTMNAPPLRNVEIYKKILYGDVDKTSDVIQSPKMHWRRKMEQNSN